MIFFSLRRVQPNFFLRFSRAPAMINGRSLKLTLSGFRKRAKSLGERWTRRAVAVPCRVSQLDGLTVVSDHPRFNSLQFFVDCNRTDVFVDN